MESVTRIHNKPEELGQLQVSCSATNAYVNQQDNVKGIDYCPIEIIKGLTDKGQFQYLTNLKGSQVGNYLYTTQFLSLRKRSIFIINYLIPSWDQSQGPVS